MSTTEHEHNAGIEAMVNWTGLVCLVRVLGVTVLCSRRVGVSRSPLPASPFVHLSTGQSSTATDAEDHTECLPCSHAQLVDNVPSDKSCRRFVSHCVFSAPAWSGTILGQILRKPSCTPSLLLALPTPTLSSSQKIHLSKDLEEKNVHQVFAVYLTLCFDIFTSKWAVQQNSSM